MNRRSNMFQRAGTIALLTAAFYFLPPPAGAETRPPNILLILVDDMGFSDPGCYGGEPGLTPHLDRLAAHGLRFRQFYNTGRCWPTRASIMTGRYPHEVGHAMMFGPKAPPAYQGTHRDRGPMIQELLKPAGYVTYHVGKWHLQSRRPDTMPLQRGFDRSYCMRSQNNFFNPYHVLDEDRSVKRPGDQGDYYVTEAFSQRAIDYLRGHDPDRPFFLYLAHTAPHFPLHALPEDIERFKTTYTRGWDELRKERLARQKKMGLFDGPLPPRDPDAAAWADLNPEERKTWAVRMAIHAAMVHCVDRGIGRIVEQLKAMNDYENTLILFLSDNGASAEYIVRGDGHDPDAPPGSGASYLCLEVGWSNAANTPFRLHKMWMHEGGIATPLIAHWPARIKARGAWTDQVGHVIDLLPTFLAMAGLEAPKHITGSSLLPILEGGRRSPPEFLFWEHVGNRALRKGDWKLVAEHNKAWELYDLKADRNEIHNLAGKHPEQVKALQQTWQAEADRIGVVDWNSLPQSKRRPSA
ncbi:MAG: arylsulfatase, partial [Verrucomicrobiota bacterium]